jgi:hypothetical protein
MAAGAPSPFYAGTQPTETAASHSVKTGFEGISRSDYSDANSTQELSNHMHIAPRQLNPKTGLADLYRRRENVVSLIRALERYLRAPVRPIQGCSRRVPWTAA